MAALSGSLGGVTGNKKKRPAPPNGFKKGKSGNPAGRQIGQRIALTELRRRLYADSGMMPLDFLVAVYRDELYTAYERHLLPDGKTPFFIPTKNAKRVEVTLNHRIICASNAASYLHKKMPVGLEVPQGNESSATAAALAALPHKSLHTLLTLIDQVENASLINGESQLVSIG